MSITTMVQLIFVIVIAEAVALVLFAIKFDYLRKSYSKCLQILGLEEYWDESAKEMRKDLKLTPGACGICQNVAYIGDSLDKIDEKIKTQEKTAAKQAFLEKCKTTERAAGEESVATAFDKRRRRLKRNG